MRQNSTHTRVKYSHTRNIIVECPFFLFCSNTSTSIPSRSTRRPQCRCQGKSVFIAVKPNFSSRQALSESYPTPRISYLSISVIISFSMADSTILGDYASNILVQFVKYFDNGLWWLFCMPPGVGGGGVCVWGGGRMSISKTLACGCFKVLQRYNIRMDLFMLVTHMHFPRTEATPTMFTCHYLCFVLWLSFTKCMIIFTIH